MCGNATYSCPDVHPGEAQGCRPWWTSGTLPGVASHSHPERTHTMPRTHAKAKKKTSAPAPTPTRAPPRRRAPQAQHETPPSAISGPDVHQGTPTILPSPELPADLPVHETLMPAPPEASYSLPASSGADDTGGAPRITPLEAAFSPALAAELAALWPDLQALASWWQERHHLAQEEETPERKLVRQTYHIEQRYIDAVRRESDRTGESYAAVVNRAFARYFAGR